jgi:DNA-binding winged helix-turn-helix (wHTH) protein/tetratricopeptide (TPR) repeat protein
MPMSYRFGEFRLCVASRELLHFERPVALSSRVFDCLLYLIEHRDRAVGRDELVAAVWGRVDVSDAQLGQIVLRVRRAVDDDGNEQRAIRTMPKFGYHWVADTRVDTDENVHAQHPVTAAPLAAGDTDADVAVPPEKNMPALRAHRRPRHFVFVLLLALAAAAAIAAVLWSDVRTPRVVQDTSAVVVLPVDVSAGSDEAWLRLGAMDAIAGRLRAAGLRVPTSEAVLAVLGAEGVAADTDPAMTVRRALDPGLVMRGKLERTPRGWRMHLDSVSGDHAEEDAGESPQVEADAAEPLIAVRLATNRLLAQLGRTPAQIGETDPQLEETVQRVEAAMLGNQLEVARAILQNAPALERAQPELRFWLARVALRAGHADEVKSELEALLGDESVSGNPLLHARILIGLGVVNINATRYADAERVLSEAIAALNGLPYPLDRSQALGNRAAARAALGRGEDALADLATARVEIEQAGDVMGLARLDMIEGTFEAKRGRVDRAVPLLQRATAAFARLDAVDERVLTTATLVASQLQQIDYAGALASSDRVWALKVRVADPELLSLLLSSRAGVLLALGRRTEADALLKEIESRPLRAKDEFVGLADLVRARLAFDRADMGEAVARADATLQRLVDPEYATMRAHLQLLRQRAQAAMEREGPSTSEQTLGDPIAAVGDVQPALLVAAAERAVRRGDDDAAERYFRAALARADAGGNAEDIIEAALSYGRWLLDRGRADDAVPVVGRSAAWAERDFRCALMATELFHALGRFGPWSSALAKAEQLAGERAIPTELRKPPGL